MAKTSEKALAASTPRPVGAPAFVIRARQEKNSRFFQSIGYVWEKTDRNGRKMLSIKINSMPLDWDGSAIAVEPFAQDEPQE